MPSNKEDIQKFKADLDKFMTTMNPLFEKLEKRVDASRLVLEELLWKVDSLENAVQALQQKQSLHEDLIADVSTTVEVINVHIGLNEVVVDPEVD